MKEDRKIEPDKIHILSIKTLKGSIDASATADNVAIGSYRFGFEVATGFNVEEHIIGLELTVVIQAVNKNKELLDIKGSYTHEFIFKVENFEDFIDKAEKAEEIKIDPIMGGTLAGIAYSTIRGIIYTRTQGTSLNAVVLPVVDPKKIMGGELEQLETDKTGIE